MGWASSENRYGDDKVFDACGLIGFIDTSGRRHSGDRVAAGLACIDERGNGLGAGYAAYGLYPEHADRYALHAMCRSDAQRAALDAYLREHFAVVHDEPVPTRQVPGILDPPVLWRYFCTPLPERMVGRTEEDYVVHQVMTIHARLEGTYIVSSGKDMGIFKGVGHPEQIAEFYRIADYSAYLWTAHNRFPTNTPGWWGGAHPFGLLDWSVVHNGEISSYGINRRTVEMHGYRCDMRTDTEVFAYAADLLIRRHGLSPRLAAAVFAPPLWDAIDRMAPEEAAVYRALRQTYGSLLMNGPFTIILARNGEMMGLGDRVRLRPLVAATRGSVLYISSELSAIGAVEPTLDAIAIPVGGQPVIGRLGEAPVLQDALPVSEAAPAFAGGT
jgi:glutamate synthase domain-containing protein 1